MQGEVYCSSITTAQENFLITDGLTEFRCGGRVGAGILEAMELKAPAPWHRELLGLDTEAGGEHGA